MRPKQKKYQWQQYIGLAFFVLLGGACGFLMVQYMEATASQERGLGEELFLFAGLMLMMYAAIFLQIIVHEAGHLLFGLWTGYRFSSFRIGSWMWIKEGDRLRFRRFSLAGTGGQCLMLPPEWNREHFPTFWYNLGGSILNLVVSGVFFAVGALLPSLPVLPLLCRMIALIGVVFAIMNGVPMRLGMTDNDGYNALSLGKNEEARRSFWIQMTVNQHISRGIRVKDMPAEWFTFPSDEGLKNAMTVVLAIFACNRLLDKKRLEEAHERMRALCQADTAMIDLHRNLLLCDCITCELLGENRPQVLAEYRDKPQQKFMKAMKKYPAVLRTEYCYALLAEKDPSQAEKNRALFDLVAKKYPYPARSKPSGS